MAIFRTAVLICLCMCMFIQDGDALKPKRLEMYTRTKRNAERNTDQLPVIDSVYAKPKRIQTRSTWKTDMDTKPKRIQRRSAWDNGMNSKPKRIQIREKRRLSEILKPKRMDIVN